MTRHQCLFEEGACRGGHDTSETAFAVFSVAEHRTIQLLVGPAPCTDGSPFASPPVSPILGVRACDKIPDIRYHGDHARANLLI